MPLTEYTEAEYCVEIRGVLTEPQFQHVYALLGKHPSRYKGSDFYVFSPGTLAELDAICDYLREIGITHQREIPLLWTPPAEHQHDTGDYSDVQ